MMCRSKLIESRTEPGRGTGDASRTSASGRTTRSGLFAKRPLHELARLLHRRGPGLQERQRATELRRTVGSPRLGSSPEPAHQPAGGIERAELRRPVLDEADEPQRARSRAARRPTCSKIRIRWSGVIGFGSPEASRCNRWQLITMRSGEDHSDHSWARKSAAGGDRLRGVVGGPAAGEVRTGGRLEPSPVLRDRLELGDAAHRTVPGHHHLGIERRDRLDRGEPVRQRPGPHHGRHAHEGDVRREHDPHVRDPDDEIPRRMRRAHDDQLERRARRPRARGGRRTSRSGRSARTSVKS